MALFIVVSKKKKSCPFFNILYFTFMEISITSSQNIGILELGIFKNQNTKKFMLGLFIQINV